MTRRNEMLGLSILTAAIILSLLLCRYYYVAEDDFRGLLAEPNTSHLASLTLLTYQCRIEVKDAELLKIFEQTFQNRAEVPGNGTLGCDTTWIFHFPSGRRFSTTVSVSDDKSVIYISDTTDLGAGDPKLRACRFTQPLNPRLKALLDKLLYFPPEISELPRATGAPTSP